MVKKPEVISAQTYWYKKTLEYFHTLGVDGGTLFVTALFSFFAEEKKAAAVLRYQEKILVVSRI